MGHNGGLKLSASEYQLREGGLVLFCIRRLKLPHCAETQLLNDKLHPAKANCKGVYWLVPVTLSMQLIPVAVRGLAFKCLYFLLRGGININANKYVCHFFQTGTSNTLHKGRLLVDPGFNSIVCMFEMQIAKPGLHHK